MKIGRNWLRVSNRISNQMSKFVNYWFRSDTNAMHDRLWSDTYKTNMRFYIRTLSEAWNVPRCPSDWVLFYVLFPQSRNMWIGRGPEVVEGARCSLYIHQVYHRNCITLIRSHPFVLSTVNYYQAWPPFNLRYVFWSTTPFSEFFTKRFLEQRKQS